MIVLLFVQILQVMHELRGHVLLVMCLRFLTTTNSGRNSSSSSDWAVSKTHRKELHLALEVDPFLSLFACDSLNLHARVVFKCIRGEVGQENLG